MSLEAARLVVRQHLQDWGEVRLADLQFWHRGEAQLALISILALAGLLLIGRSLLARQPGRHRLVVPAILASVGPSYLALVRHIPLTLFLIGLPFFALALADPFTALVTSDVTYPGRRISVMID